jgi:hypothetical protein
VQYKHVKSRAGPEKKGTVNIEKRKRIEGCQLD